MITSSILHHPSYIPRGGNPLVSHKDFPDELNSVFNGQNSYIDMTAIGIDNIEWSFQYEQPISNIINMQQQFIFKDKEGNDLKIISDMGQVAAMLQDTELVKPMDGSKFEMHLVANHMKN